MSRMNPSQAEKRLVEGNAGFVRRRGSGLKVHASGQKPFAAVLTCSDSRVPPELIFDADIGDIFVVRVAGNVVLGASVIGSLEYAVEHLRVPLVVIMGHTCCGAVEAAKSGATDDSCVGDIVKEIQRCFGEGDVVKANVRRQVAKLVERSRTIHDEVKAGRLRIHGAIYHLETGKVEML